MVIRSLIAILILGLSVFYAAELRSSREFTTEIPSLEQLPRELNGWIGEDFLVGTETARVLAADATLRRRFRRIDGAEVWMFVSYFAQQQVNSQIHSPRNCIPAGGWNVASIQQERLDLDGDTQTASHMRMRKNEHSQEAFYWFCTQGGVVAGEYALKWDLVKNSLARRPTNAAFVRYTAQSADSCALHEVMSLMHAPLSQLLAEVGL
jgi:EpsI family protein